MFAGTTLLPSDAAEVVLSRSEGAGGGTPEQIAALRTQLGLDRPWPQRYLDWAGGLLHGQLGTSLISGRPVADIIGDRLGNTLILAGIAAVLLVPIAVGLGVWAALRQGRAGDRVTSVTAIGLQALPEFVAATVLIAVFALALRWLPPVSFVAAGTSPLAQPAGLVLPVASLLTVMAGQSIRMVRARAGQVTNAEYVRMARLHGIPERRVVWRYVLPNALAPALQLLASSVAWLVGGVVVVEQVFAYPGISDELVAAIATRDEPVVQALALVMAVVTIAAYTVADLLALVLVPKLRTEGLR
ncbi:peptide/nickel transport system permease protein [Kibdelosporangium banguiense]|uniref:Peptide/nickel transport system permease protein n=1 Tax=Kibdelosporangium banguiense TaxID=1365924 RepID=A0ABS4U2X0_9PSEU|nr:peptide/nickel transport system permease protein [Kibdelosporangium banguiense]